MSEELKAQNEPLPASEPDPEAPHTVEPTAAPALEAPEAEAAPAVEDQLHADPAETHETAHVDSETSAHHPEPDPVSTQDQVVLGAAGVAATAGAAAAMTPPPSDKRPIWSDQGDAPFESRHDAGRMTKAKKTKDKSGGDDMWEIVKTIVFALLIATVLRILFFQPFTIPSASMEPNLYEGDYIVVSKWSYGYSKHSIPWSPPLFEGRIMGRSPQRGDVVVFKLPRDNKTDYIKRVIGLPGDRVQMVGNVLHINGQPVRDAVVGRGEVADLIGQREVTRLNETLPGSSKTFAIQDFGPGYPLDSTPVFEVPAGHYFMMGDNRDNSVDSREQSSAGVGLVPAENLVGKAEMILFSWRPGASLFKPWTWVQNVRPSRFFTVLD